MKKNGLHISLRPGERIYVNGAVLQVDRKVSIEFLNDVTFLLEQHVLQPQDTRSPLRQLYFIIQTVLIDPANGRDAEVMFEKSYTSLLEAVDNERIRAGLAEVRETFDRGRPFDALKVLRSLFPIEDAILAEAKGLDDSGNHQQCEVH
jgi:flagellar biosynthesis repressor protein FlbT